MIAATLNGTGFNTFAMSTGTSNCKPGSNYGMRTANLFINVNKESLAKDISKGSGESLSHLAEIMGCSDNAALSGKLQKNYREIFPNENSPAEATSEKIFNMIKSDKELAKTCKYIG